MILSRTCCMCGEEKPLEEFESNPKKPHGKGYRCHPCNRLRSRSDYKSLISTRPLNNCKWCDKEHRMANKNHITCSISCRNFLSFKDNDHKYITSLLYGQRREDGLTREDIESLLDEQGGICALSGEPMTMVRGQGRVTTNLSIDRIEAGGLYTKDNIQLVCNAVNSFRGDTNLEEYIDWCIKVSDRWK